MFGHNDPENQGQQNNTLAGGIDLAGRHNYCLNWKDALSNYTSYST